MIFRIVRWLLAGFIFQLFGSLIVGALVLYVLLGGGDTIKEMIAGWWGSLSKTTIQVNVEQEGQKSQYNLLTPQK